jgi:hypothetical protein
MVLFYIIGPKLNNTQFCGNLPPYLNLEKEGTAVN